MNTNIYSIGGHLLAVTGNRLYQAVTFLDNFKNFVYADSTEGYKVYRIEELAEKKDMEFEEQKYHLYEEGVHIYFGTTAEGYRLRLIQNDQYELNLYAEKGADIAYLYGDITARLLPFALWVGYGILTSATNTVLVHSSCIVNHDRGIMFLGESGTGKSTHTRLWRENVPGAHLLNDDSPVLRVEGDKVYVYGSPWSGKTPCYRTERFELLACVRLSQAPYNKITRLPVLQAYASLHPSCPPAFAYVDSLYDNISNTLGEVISRVACYKMECLPDAAAAKLSHKTIFNL